MHIARGSMGENSEIIENLECNIKIVGTAFFFLDYRYLAEKSRESFENLKKCTDLPASENLWYGPKTKGSQNI